MRLALVASFALVVAAPAFAGEAAVAAASKIARVTVYEDRALVTRSAVADLAQGVTRVAIEHLPPGLDPSSVRARCASARVLGVDLETVHLERESREDLAKAAAAHATARRELTGAEMELSEAKDAWERLRSIRAKGIEGAERALGGAGGADPTAIKRLLELVGDEGAAARRAVLIATESVERARLREEAARARVDELRTGSDRVESRVVVTLEADAATAAAPISLQYLIAGASWQPVYELRVDDTFGAASLGLGAVVTQRTGESWDDVALEVTTAQPSAGASPPSLDPWRIFVPRRRGDVGLVAVESKDDAMPAAPAPTAAADAWDKGFAPVVRRSGLVVAFASRTTETVASDGNPSRVVLARFDLAPDVRWNAVPRLTDKVFVTAKMTNTTGAPLPAGDVRVFVGSDYVGPMQLADWGMGKEIDVGLGVDREVEVERETLAAERSTEGVFSKETVHTRGFRLSVKNHRDRAIGVRLLDQIPVSGDEEVVVKLLSSSLPPADLPARDAETNKARGIVEWRFDLAAKTDRDVRFSFEIRHPRSLTVSGLGE